MLKKSTSDLPTPRDDSPRTLQSALVALPLYPFRGRGIVLLFVGTPLLWVAGFIPLIGAALQLVAMVYMLAYFRDIIGSSANGDDELPGWPDVSDLLADVLRPALMFVACGVVCLLPGFLACRWFGPATGVPLVLIGVGVYCLPMAMLAVVLFDSVLALNPLTVVSAILRIPMQYTFLVVVIVGVWGLSYLLDSLVARVWPILGDLLAAFLSIYEAALVMRSIGVIYHAHARQIGWFYRERGVCRQCGYDLRGMRPRPGTVCPECGTVLPNAVLATIPPARQ